MRTQSISSSSAVVELTVDDLSMLNNALNEVCNGLDLEEFSTRMGAEKQNVLKLLHRVREVLDGVTAR
jgi:hypothetical protein